MSEDIFFWMHRILVGTAVKRIPKQKEEHGHPKDRESMAEWGVKEYCQV